MDGQRLKECVWKQVQAGFEELVRVTKPGGRVMVGRMNSKEVFDQIGEESIKRNYAKYVPRQVSYAHTHTSSPVSSHGTAHACDLDIATGEGEFGDVLAI